MNDIIELISFKNEVNKVGNTIKTKTYRKIFANKKSITKNEYKIIRTYKTSADKIELILEGVE